MATIKEKIQKLLALASSPNEHEAKAALLKAKELMAKNKMTEADFEEIEKQELVHVVCSQAAWTTDSGNIWMTNLCKLICDEYLCTAAWSVPKGHRTYTLVITGMKEDADLCKSVVEYAVGYVLSAIKSLQRRYRHSDSKSVAKSYAEGFIVGLELAFDMQRQEHPGWALVVVKPDEVQKYEDGLGNRNVKTKKTDFDPLAYMKGQTDGKNFNSKKVIEQTR